MKNNVKKLLSVFLAALMIFSMIPLSASAAETTPTVKIVSFMRGEQADLRSSELLEARVTGYDGNVQELTYKWTTTLGTYLYVYNSHNMYGINNTAGEVEVYCDSKLDPVGNMDGRDYPDTFSGKGYAWAAVYGANLQNLNSSRNNSLVGVVTVEVFDENGKPLCRDTHEGKYENRTLSGFINHNLDSDIDNVVIGLFEGEKVNALDLLGRSGVVHITCTASKVTKATFDYGTEYAYVDQETNDDNNNGFLDYYIVGKKAGNKTDANGDAKLNITITKDNCKFHKNSSGSASPIVYVFKKPTTSTTTTTLTLDKDSIDSRCEYFINGNQGKVQDDGSIIFTGLTPNTEYQVDVRAHYEDDGETKYVYAFVNDTTKPVYKATVNTYLDGELTDISKIHGEDVELYLREQTTEETIKLEKPENTTGIYTASVVNGIYYPLHIEEGNHEHKAREYKLIIENKNNSVDLHHYSVKYNTNGGAFKAGEEVETEIYSSMAAVNATANIPVQEGYVFAGWEYNEAVYAPGAEVISAISAPITLTAKWEKEVNVTINVTINHKADGGYDPDENRDRLAIDFLEMTAGSPALVETGNKLNFTIDGVTNEQGEKVAYIIKQEKKNDVALVTKYTSDGVTYSGLLESSSFGVALSKTGYDVVVGKTQDENGDWTIDVELTYNPNDFNLDFSVEMEEGVPTELYPDAVIVKIAFWNGKDWEIITQQKTTDMTTRPGVRVDIDKTTGKGAGSYPVWMYDAKGEAYGYRAVVTGFIYKDSTIVVPTYKDHFTGEGKVIINYTDGNYTATMGAVSDGYKFGESLYGAYYNDETKAQQGTLHGVISVEKYNVTFDAQGGTIKNEATYTAENQYYIPSFEDYKPVMEGHEFKGWYTDAECTIPATEGELLTKDVTLYAEWDKILTGTIIVDGYYTDGDKQIPVDDVDRAKYALIELEEITPDGSYDIAGQTVEIIWDKDATEHYSKPSAYKFTGLDPDKTYRINVYLMNYDAAYQNSTTEYEVDGDKHGDYNDEDYTAVYPADSRWETFVNTFMHFVPEEYIQNVQVDATLIGAGFRPTNALVKYYSEELGVDDDYVLIVQHKDEDAGVAVGLKADGTNDGTYGEEVWKKNYTGNLYDYQADLAILGGKAVSEWPVSVVYGASARWSPLNNAPTGDLQIKLVPNRYDIIYNENYSVEGVNVVTHGTHLWSYETPITYEPTRVGYTFEGWYANPEFTGEKVTSIAADIHENTNLYAKWTALKNNDLTVKYVYKDANNNEEVLDIVVYGSQSYDAEIAAEGFKKDIPGYTYASASPEKITITSDSTKNVITLYYNINSYGYTVNYYIENTEIKLADSKTGEALYGSEFIEYAVDVDGYFAVEGIKIVKINNGENVINFYYTLGTYEYTVNYIEKGTDNVLDTQKSTAKYCDVITAESLKKDFAGFTFDSSASAESITIGTGTNVINLYYSRNNYDYTVNYLELGTGNAIADAKTGTAAYGSTIKSEKEVVEFEKYDFIYADPSEILIGTSGNVINLYYSLKDVKYIVKHYKADENGNYPETNVDKEEFIGKVGETVVAKPKTYADWTLDTSKTDESQGVLEVSGTQLVLKLYYFLDSVGAGADGNDSDGTPDMYQKRVEFEIVNGTWADGKNKNIVEYVTLEKDGVADKDGTATVEVPTGMIPYEGYENGQWNVTVEEYITVSGKEAVIYRYTFEKIPVAEPENPGIGGDGDIDGDGTLDGDTKHTIVFGKTNAIGWYNVSLDGGETYQIVQGNSTLEVEIGTEIIVKASNPFDGSFTFYVNGDIVEPNENGELRVVVDGALLIGAWSIEIEDKTPEESLNWFQKIIKAIKDFFAKLFGKK